MMVKRVRVSAKTKPKSKSMTLAPALLTLFGEPQLLGEEAAAYDELRAGIRAAVRPVDIVEEMFIADVVALEWEVLRWRRLKLGLIRARVLEALILQENLDYDLYPDDVVEVFRTIFHKPSRKIRRCWRISVRRMNRQLSTG